MRALRGLAALAGVALLVAPRVEAEPLGAYLYFTPFGGYALFDRDFRYQGKSPLSNSPYVGGRLGFQTTRWLGLEVGGGLAPTSEDIPSGRDVDFMHGSADALLTLPGRYGGPFLLLGGGIGQYKLSSGGPREHQGNGEIGAGALLWLSDIVGVRLEGRDLLWLPKDEPTSPAAQQWMLGGGITFAIGATPRDTDGDGVPDRKDRCPDTPKGATVDAAGCPHDADGDKVLDGLDQCPGTPPGATVDEHGCPHDADGDQVWDGLDQCPDTPKGATVDEHGCPHDSDGDGVLDGLDQCPDTPKGATVDERGCPKDSDHDGVPDGIDKCPDTSPGLKVDRDGCSIEVTEKETELLDTGMIRLQNINFETGKAELLPESKPLLDVVGQVLTRWPELRIEIGGHTDSRGSAAANQKLSEARVQAVLDHLLAAFPTMKREQFATKGYGESKPIAPNNTVDGMALNRRVEFVVLNKEVLKREIEKRHLLKQGEGAPADTTKK